MKKRIRNIIIVTLLLTLSSCSLIDKISLNFLPSGVGIMSKWGAERQFLVINDIETDEYNPFIFAGVLEEDRMVQGSVTKTTTFFPISIIEIIITAITGFILNILDFVLWIILIIPYILSNMSGIGIIGNVIIGIAQFIYYFPIFLTGLLGNIFNLDNDLTLTIAQLLSYNTIFIALIVKGLDKFTNVSFFKHLFISLRSFFLFVGLCFTVFLAAHAIPETFTQFEIIGIKLFNPFFTKLWFLANAGYFFHLYTTYEDEKEGLQLAEEDYNKLKQHKLIEFSCRVMGELLVIEDSKTTSIKRDWVRSYLKDQLKVNDDKLLTNILDYIFNDKKNNISIENEIYSLQTSPFDILPDLATKLADTLIFISCSSGAISLDNFVKLKKLQDILYITNFESYICKYANNYNEVNKSYKESQNSNKQSNNSNKTSFESTDQQDKIKEYYSILECDEYSSPSEIKKSYRKKVAQYHPDKIQGKGLSEDFIKFAEYKFKLLQEAYEYLLKVAV